MANAQNRVELKGSTRAQLSGAQDVGPADPNQQIEVTVYLRSGGGEGRSADEIGALPISERKYLTREELGRRHGASNEDIAKIRAFAADSGLQVESADPAARQVKLAGTVQAFSEAFGTTLRHCEHPSGRFRYRTGNLTVPSNLAGVINAVLGLDNRPQAKAHFRLRKARSIAPTQATAVFAAASRASLRFSGERQWLGPVHWNHRTRRRLQVRRFEFILQ